MPTTVVVIGGGALGLAAAKNFKEDGFDVTLYETRDYIGGLWKDSEDNTLSVHAGTIFNSSKFRTQMSDFPFSDSTDPYPTAAQIHNYLLSYAEHFDLNPIINLSTRVKSIAREGNRWLVTTEKKGVEKQKSEYFDKVYVATGTFSKPKWPVLEGLEKFAGKVCHSIDYHTPDEYKNQNVMLVGMHATAQDVTNDLSKAAKKVYLSHRSGLTLVRRFTPEGVPFDATLGLGFTFIQVWLQSRLPRLFFWLIDGFLSKNMVKNFPGIKKSWGLTPAPSLAVSTPLMADTLWPFLESGFAEPVPAIRRITGPSTLELTNGQILENIDSIIYCTGYDMNIPDQLIPESLPGEESIHPYPKGNMHKEPRLYRNIFPIHSDESIRTSLAYAGQGGIPFPGFVTHEVLSLAVSQVWQGKSKLPGPKQMIKWYENHVRNRQKLAKRYKPKENSTFYPIFMEPEDHFKWLDKTAGIGFYANFGSAWFNWRAWSFWLHDRAFYNLCLNGVFTPALWRLFDMGRRKPLPWDECKAMIESQNRKLKELAKPKNKKEA